jgi:superfamily II DNA or RNA helicase
MAITGGLTQKLFPWQQDALEKWLANGSRGIIQAAAGTGKTTVALAAIAELDEDSLRVCIVVPRVVLVEQWRRALQDGLAIPRHEVGVLGGGGRHSGQRVVVAIINSARDHLPPLVAQWKRQGRRVLLVVDECHWAGSPVNSRIFEARCDYTLGLSATPERNDEGLEEVLLPQLGPITYDYPLLQALDDEILAPLRCVDLYVDLESDELVAYEELTERIRVLREALRAMYQEFAAAGDRWLIVLKRLAVFDPQAELLSLLLFKRRRLVSSARRRSACLDALIEERVFEGRKVIVFHETIETAEATRAKLSPRYRVFTDHSECRTRESEAAQRGFAAAPAGVLVVVRKADEGLDIPDAELAVIISGTLTRRQRIQRIGRILRRSKGTALCISLLARGTTEEHLVGADDDDLVGAHRVRHHRWPTVKLHHALSQGKSTYQPRLALTPLRKFQSHSERCSRCNHPKDGSFAHCASCGLILDAEKASRQQAGGLLKPPQPKPKASTRSKPRILSMGDDPNWKRCRHCRSYIAASSVACRFCQGSGG